jgi:hypothetical protein
MAARPIWSGFLKLSLVSVPVKAYTATDSSGEVHLNQLHAECKLLALPVRLAQASCKIPIRAALCCSRRRVEDCLRGLLVFITGFCASPSQRVI